MNNSRRSQLSSVLRSNGISPSESWSSSVARSLLSMCFIWFAGNTSIGLEISADHDQICSDCRVVGVYHPASTRALYVCDKEAESATSSPRNARIVALADENGTVLSEFGEGHFRKAISEQAGAAWADAFEFSDSQTLVALDEDNLICLVRADTSHKVFEFDIGDGVVLRRIVSLPEETSEALIEYHRDIEMIIDRGSRIAAAGDFIIVETKHDMVFDEVTRERGRELIVLDPLGGVAGSYFSSTPVAIHDNRIWFATNGHLACLDSTGEVEIKSVDFPKSICGPDPVVTVANQEFFVVGSSAIFLEGYRDSDNSVCVTIADTNGVDIRRLSFARGQMDVVGIRFIGIDSLNDIIRIGLVQKVGSQARTLDLFEKASPETREIFDVRPVQAKTSAYDTMLASVDIDSGTIIEIRSVQIYGHFPFVRLEEE